VTLNITALTAAEADEDLRLQLELDLIQKSELDLISDEGSLAPPNASDHWNTSTIRHHRS